MFFSGYASAVNFLYRVGSRPPDVIFRNGFSSHGNNRNLQQPIRGDSCAAGSRDSNYIATASDINENTECVQTIVSTVFHRLSLILYLVASSLVIFSEL